MFDTFADDLNGHLISNNHVLIFTAYYQYGYYCVNVARFKVPAELMHLSHN